MPYIMCKTRASESGNTATTPGRSKGEEHPNQPSRGHFLQVFSKRHRDFWRDWGRDARGRGRTVMPAVGVTSPPVGPGPGSIASSPDACGNRVKGMSQSIRQSGGFFFSTRNPTYTKSEFSILSPAGRYQPPLPLPKKKSTQARALHAFISPKNRKP